MLGRKAWPQQTVAVLSAAWTTNVLVVVHTLVEISLDVVVVVRTYETKYETTSSLTLSN